MYMINRRLEEYIFENLGAEYAPDADSARYNLDNDEEKNRRYLGTYFPRSFVESYHIYRQLFDNTIIRNYFNRKPDISVLAIGSGTGGDILGLLQALNECYTNKNIIIYSFDGNQNALAIQGNLIDNFYDFMPQNHNRIYVNAYQVAFTCVNDIAYSLHQYNIPPVDIMQSFKMCNEIYNQVNGGNVFYELVELSERCLYQNGILVLEDVTNQNSDGRYNSVVMSEQLRRYFSEHPHSNLKYIIPICCAKWYNRCRWNNCLSIVEYKVSHRWVVNEKSKVTYRVIIKNPLGLEIYNTIGEGDCYQLAPKTYCTRDNYLYNQSEAPSDNVKDPYRIS